MTQYDSEVKSGEHFVKVHMIEYNGNVEQNKNVAKIQRRVVDYKKLDGSIMQH